MEFLRLDNGGLMTSKQYKQHLRSILYYNGLVAQIPQFKAGTTKYMELMNKIKQAQGYIERDTVEAKKKADKLIQN